MNQEAMTKQILQNPTSSTTLIHQQLHLVSPERFTYSWIAPTVLCAGEVHNANSNIQFGAHPPNCTVYGIIRNRQTNWDTVSADQTCAHDTR